MKIDFKGLSVEDINHQYTGCWYMTKAGKLVRLEEANKNGNAARFFCKPFDSERERGLGHMVEFKDTDIDFSFPEMGYGCYGRSYLNLGRSCQRQWRKGFRLQVCKSGHMVRGYINGSTRDDANAAACMFIPNFKTFEQGLGEIGNERGARIQVLSKSLLLYRHERGNYLAYRGDLISKVNAAGKIKLPDSLAFMKEKLTEEIDNGRFI